MTIDDLLQERSLLNTALMQQIARYYAGETAAALPLINDLERALYFKMRAMAELTEDDSDWWQRAQQFLVEASRWHVREGHYIHVTWQWDHS